MEHFDSGATGACDERARGHVISSHGENLRQQRPKLKQPLTANDGDKNPENDLLLVQWPRIDLASPRARPFSLINYLAGAITLWSVSYDRKSTNTNTITLTPKGNVVSAEEDI
jgi:hypothetical protein